jgi:hypothetical protein
MSKDKIKKPQPEVVLDGAPAPEANAPVPNSAPAPKMFLMEADKLSLDLAKEQRKTALAEAKTAIANNEKAELSFKYTVLQLYMKYGLTENDAISEQGEIIKNGAVRPPPQQQE